MQRPSPRFRSEEYFVYELSEEMFYPNFIKRFHLYGDAMLVLDELQHGGPCATFMNKSYSRYIYLSSYFSIIRLWKSPRLFFVSGYSIPAKHLGYSD